MNVSTVFRCVKLLSEGVASLPVKCKALRSGVYVTDERDRLNYLLNVAPNPRQNAFDFWRNVVSDILL
ncbi:MAG: phage portal protein, partial [Muribaculaceae bacterium]|nr:phage portal protein [Muribaculaceae bacterium]